MSDSTDPTNPDDTSAENFAALRATNDATKRENAFLRAGVDVDSPQGKLLMKGYEGALEVDAIKAYRDEIFPAATPAAEPAADPTPDPAPDPDPYAQETAGAQAMRDALAGQGAPGQIDTDPPAKNKVDETYEAYYADRRNGVPQDRATLGAIDRFIVAAAEGNTDVLLDPADWDRQKAAAGHTPRGGGQG